MAGQQDPPAQLSPQALPRPFFEREPLVVAPELLGAVVEVTTTDGGRRVAGSRDPVASGRVAVRITEVEAYLGEGEDPASHSYRGLRPRNRVMFGPPGHLYVYFTYGMHWCANLVCRPEGVSGAVLLRAGQVVTGLGQARDRRPSSRRDTDLARGPARLATTLGLTGVDDGLDVCRPPDRKVRVLAGDPVDAGRIRSGPRVGVTLGAHEPWRFWLDGETTVSVFRPAKPRRRNAVDPAG